MNPSARTHPPSDLAKVRMMGEVDHLPNQPHLADELERLLGPEIVKYPRGIQYLQQLRHNVIADNLGI
ncbi:MAG: hypothetical protein ABII76_07995 [Pseudomonadota bacterium]|jgi:hypothetical protein